MIYISTLPTGLQLLFVGRLAFLRCPGEQQWRPFKPVAHHEIPRNSEVEAFKWNR